MTAEPLQILVVEDDPKVAHTIATSLRQHGLHARRCGNGQEALNSLNDSRVDMVLLDLGLPDLDGLEILRSIRRRTHHLPVLILTARDAVDDRITGLDCGADDYLVKPFSLSELVARIHALARRVDLGRQTTFTCDDLVLDTSSRAVSRSGNPIDLSPREFLLLHYLLEHQGEVVTRTMLASNVWDYTSRATPIDNVIDVQMSRLREKVDKPYAVHLIHTVRGVGFCLGADA